MKNDEVVVTSELRNAEKNSVHTISRRGVMHIISSLLVFCSLCKKFFDDYKDVYLRNTFLLLCLIIYVSVKVLTYTRIYKNKSKLHNKSTR